MMDCSKVENNIKKIKAKLVKDCQLIAVSKYRSLDEINCAYTAGQRIFAENRVQALIERKENLPNDIEWHLIGHLQRNKVKYIASFISMIHSVDSFKLLKEIDKNAQSNNRTIDCLLQVHIAQEDTKFGLSPNEVITLIKNENWEDLTNIRIVGLMAMATNTPQKKAISQEFNQVKLLFEEAKEVIKKSYFKELSIGMSSDYLLAQDFGSTMVRIGSGIFN